MATLVGWIAYLLGIRRRVALANLRRAGIEGAQARRVLRRAAVQLAHGVVDLLSPPRVEIAGLDRLERARALGRGVLVLTAHIGPFDALACAVARRGVPLHVVSRRLRAGALDRAWWRLRARAGVVLHEPRGSALALRAALRRNEVVALVLDQHAPPPDGAPIPLFGEPAWTSLALARLAEATGAPVLPVFVRRGPASDDARAEVGDPIAPVEGSARRARWIDATRRYNLVIECAIHAAPDQWFWWHRRWKPAYDRAALHMGPLPETRGIPRLRRRG